MIMTTTSHSKENNDEKVTNEKSVSLSPLNFKEALEALLKVKPEEIKEKKSTDAKKDGK